MAENARETLGARLTGVRIGFAMTGSFCTFKRVLPQVDALTALGAQVTPILSQNAYEMDTRFMTAQELYDALLHSTGKKPLHTIPEVEPIGPGKLLDLLIVAPMTGNTMAKIALGLVDTPVAMAVKSHLRNARPVLLAVSTNDGLSNGAKNLGALLNMRNVLFVPFGQDDPKGKPNSLVACMELLPEAAAFALEGKTLQPLLIPQP